MKRGLLYASMALILLGVAGSLFADQNTYVSAVGLLHESLLTPISALLLVLGILTFFYFWYSFPDQEPAKTLAGKPQELA